MAFRDWLNQTDFMAFRDGLNQTNFFYLVLFFQFQFGILQVKKNELINIEIELNRNTQIDFLKFPNQTEPMPTPNIWSGCVIVIHKFLSEKIFSLVALKFFFLNFFLVIILDSFFDALVKFAISCIPDKRIFIKNCQEIFLHLFWI